MKRIFAGLAVAVAALAVAAPSGMSASSKSEATFTVAFSADNLSATITASKGVSHFVYELCDGTIVKVELSGADKVVNVGPFSSPIVSITVKAGTSVQSYASGVVCGEPPKEKCTDEKGDPIDCPEDPKKP